MYFTYTFILTVLLVAVSPLYVVRFRKYLPTLPDRFGFLKLPQLEGSIWVHAVSVGEVKAVENLLERLRRQFPRKPMLLSTTTPAGQELARRRKDIVDHTFYFPIDLPYCVNRALRRTNPDMVIIAETEIWPNFLRICRRRRIPVIMINGRISDKSFPRYRLVRHWLRQVFGDYTLLGMQSEIDRRRIEAIGADPDKVTVFGNLKYDTTTRIDPVETGLASAVRTWSRVWIAASTMPGEEELLLTAFAEIRKNNPGLKLILAPRHIERADAVGKMIEAKHLQCIRRTRLGSGLDGSDILLLDTIGELAGLFQYATVVFMGGSLVAKGGHNILEPARHGKAIVFGPHMDNFREMAEMFVAAGAAIQVRNASELPAVLARVLTNAELAAELGQNARALVEQNAGATNRVLEYLQPAGVRR
jgi:3-deoxy-D-manno-octulosonic-acid transferase